MTILPGIQYGTFRNGSWTGKCGFLERGDADLTISELAMTPERALVLDYSVPVIQITLDQKKLISDLNVFKIVYFDYFNKEQALLELRLANGNH